MSEPDHSAGEGGRGDAWLLLEIELWLHGARDPEMRAALADRFAKARWDLGVGIEAWAVDAGITIHRPIEDVSAGVLGVLLGAAIQHRLDPDSIPTASVVGAVRDLISAGEHADQRDQIGWPDRNDSLEPPLGERDPRGPARPSKDAP